MKKEVIIVPRDKCPLDVLAEMGKLVKESWIFLNFNAIDKLKGTSDEQEEVNRGRDLKLIWNATDKYPQTEVVIDICGFPADWKPITLISATDIYYDLMPVNPEDIFFLKMEE